jgi:hypothetical protein
MELSQEQGQRINEHLDATGAHGPCAACGSSSWSILSSAAISMAREIPSPTLPVVLMLCENCGNLRLHAAKKIGLDDLP